MATNSGVPTKLRTLGIWLLTAVLALLLTAAGAGKFLAAEMWTGLFAGWGYPPWFSYVVGVTEIGGALALLVPRTATYAAGILMVVMISATITLLLNPGELGVIPSLVNFGGLAIVAWVRKKERWTPA